MTITEQNKVWATIAAEFSITGTFPNSSLLLQPLDVAVFRPMEQDILV